MLDSLQIPTSDVRTYQVNCLRSELDYVSRPKTCGVEHVPFLRRHALQFFWTVTRAAGLGDTRHTKRRCRIGIPEIGEHAIDLGTTCSLEPSQPRILVEVSTTAFVKEPTGIQQVVREFAAACYALGVGHPVIITRDGIFSALSDPDAPPLPLRHGDHLFLLDASWSLVEEIETAIRAVVALGGRASVCVHDLVPLLYRELTAPGVAAMYRTWFERVLPLCDTVFCTSRCVAGELDTYLDNDTSIAPRPAIEVLEPGVRRPVSSVGRGSERLRQICDPTRTFLSVGTIEPRKGFPVALEAFEALWAEGRPLNYLIIGRSGWHMSFFEARIRSHPRYGTQLHWLNDASDEEVAYAYGYARALIAPSLAEGFGLPLIEAAHAGLPLIVSDIPVFREVTGGRALFVPPCQPNQWAAAIARCSEEDACPPRPIPRAEVGWQHAVEMVRDVVWSCRRA